MTNIPLDKSKFDNSWYKPGPFWKRAIWYIVNNLVFVNPFFPFTAIKPIILRIFGAKVGRHCLIKPSVNIKYPWFLHIGDRVGIGEGVWIDNLAQVTLEDQVTLSQGVLLLTGNHDYKAASFDLMLGPISIGKGAWIGAKVKIGPDVTIGEMAVASFGSVITKDCEPFGIYYGNPAILIRKREIKA